MISHISSYHASADRALHIFADRCTSVSSGNTIVFICRFLSFFCLPHCSWCYFLKFTINLYFSLYEMLFTLTFCKILWSGEGSPQLAAGAAAAYTVSPPPQMRDVPACICISYPFFCLPHCSWCSFLKFTMSLFFSLYEMLFTLTFCKILYMVRERITPVGCRGCRRLRSLPSTPDEGCSCLHLHLHYWSNTNKLINCKFMNFYFVFLALILLPSIHITCY
jgi:hypothetical protein